RDAAGHRALPGALADFWTAARAALAVDGRLWTTRQSPGATTGRNQGSQLCSGSPCTISADCPAKIGPVASQEPRTTQPSTTDSMDFHCTGWGRPRRVPASAAGRRASCPQCNAVVQVPDGQPGPSSSPNAMAPVAAPAAVAWAMAPE